MSASGRGCVKTQEAVATTQQRNRRPGLSIISDARETWDLNQSCAQVTRQTDFTQPRSDSELTASPRHVRVLPGSGHPSLPKRRQFRAMNGHCSSLNTPAAIEFLLGVLPTGEAKGGS